MQRTIAHNSRTAPRLLVVALLITALGGVLRIDALVSRYGPIERPSWARAIGEGAAAAARQIRPPGFTWQPDPKPYVGGDPINYLRFAREMRSFYQGHVREPVFVAITKGFLWLLDDEDVAISFASAAMSTLAIPATYALGTAAFSPWVGLLAALGLAIDFDTVSWAADGWRDDTFMCFVALTAWAFVRLRRRPSRFNALLLGVTATVACLTRITAVSFVLPGLAWLLVDAPPDERRVRARYAAGALLIAAALIAPYLVNSARVLGNPLIAIDAHTRYYRASEGLPSDAPQGALAYIGSKLAHKPLHTLDTAAGGLFVHPVQNKWSGFDLWRRGLAWWLRLVTVAGLVLFAFVPDGRLLLVLLFTSLIPYAFTWNLGGGSEYRFTMHAYPIFLIAAAYALQRAGSAAAALRPSRRPEISVTRGQLLAGGIVLLMAAAAVTAHRAMPFYVIREAIAAGESTSVAAGVRDHVFFVEGWSAPRTDGAVTARVSVAERAILRIPLPEERQYSLVFRIDPVTAEAPQSVALLLNRRLIARLRLGLNPERVGSYPVRIPPGFARVGRNELEFIPDRTVPAGAAGPRYDWLDPETTIGIRLWLVRVLPE